MKAIYLFLLLVIMCSFKGDNYIDSDYVGRWISRDDDNNIQSVVFLAYSKKENHMELYYNHMGDKPFCILKFKKGGNFTGKKTEILSTNRYLDHYFSGYFYGKALRIGDEIMDINTNPNIRIHRSTDYIYRK